MKKENEIIAKFTLFEQGTSWCSGKVGNLNFQAKLSDKKEDFGIQKSRVLKLSIWKNKTLETMRIFSDSCVMDYNKQWIHKVKKEYEEYFEAVMELINNNFK